MVHRLNQIETALEEIKNPSAYVKAELAEINKAVWKLEEESTILWKEMDPEQNIGPEPERADPETYPKENVNLDIFVEYDPETYPKENVNLDLFAESAESAEFAEYLKKNDPETYVEYLKKNDPDPESPAEGKETKTNPK